MMTTKETHTRTYVGIRDDDTNALTSPDTLERIFGDIWDIFPVTLACIPFISPNADVPDASRLNRPRAISTNDNLRSYIKDRIEDEQVEIAQHGYSHEYPDGTPEYVGGAELIKKTKRGKTELESAFDTNVQFFVPPHVRLSRHGLEAVLERGMDIVRGRGPRPRETQFTARYLTTYGRLLGFYLRHRKDTRFPYPLDYGTHMEILSHRVNEDINVETVKRSFEYIHSRGGVFVLSTHANQLSDRGFQNLQEIIAFIRDHDVSGGTASAIRNHYASGR